MWRYADSVHVQSDCLLRRTGYRKSVTGYVSTASYTGTVSCRLLKDVTYTVTYVGTPIKQPPVETESPQETVEQLSESAEQPDAPSDTGTPDVSESSENQPTDAEALPEAEKADDGDSPEKGLLTKCPGSCRRAPRASGRFAWTLFSL